MKKRYRYIMLAILLAAGAGVLVTRSGRGNAAKPEDNRFDKVVLAGGLNEPMEMAIDHSGNVFITERRGNLRYFPHGGDSLKTIASLQVFTGRECGLLGIALHPEYHENNLIFVFYTPRKDRHRVSSFEFRDGALASEKVYLEIPLDTTGPTAHTGGDLAFGEDGVLFISVGDNTNPSESGGYSPIDERPGRTTFNAQRTASNPSDLRGKILRILPRPDGTYVIPEGNLFANGDGRPEIFCMGCRNPYRIAYDTESRTVFWGDIGPDAGNDSTGRGPRGYDEINHARTAGNYGWPYLIGDNKPYNRYDFETGASGDVFRNSGLTLDSVNIPDARGAWIWYPYMASPEFPLLKEGGRSAMAGPVYRSSRYAASTRFPEYYDGRLFFFDWMRGWIMTAPVGEKDEAAPGIEPFAPHLKLVKPIDLDFGPDGTLYLLEYGTNWFAANADAHLTRITYTAGNRPPVAQIVTDRKHGTLPMKVGLTARGSKDYDGDSLLYEWKVDGVVMGKARDYYPTFTTPGVRQITLTVNDQHGHERSASCEIAAGNDAPEVAIELSGNCSFYWGREERSYRVGIRDYEDGDSELKALPGSARTSFEYVPGGHDLALATDVHAPGPAGKQLMEKSDCNACHQTDAKSVGPSFTAIAKRYAGKQGSIQALASKIRNGGKGNWGDISMSAHPQIPARDAEEMVRYILTLPKPDKTLPLAGTISTHAHAPGAGGVYVLTARYTDAGAAGVPALSAESTVVFRPPRVEAETLPGFTVFSSSHIGDTRHGDHTVLRAIDLAEVRQVRFSFASNGAGCTAEIRLDSLRGKKIGEAILPVTGTWSDWKVADAALPETQGSHDIYIVLVNEKSNGGPLINLDWIEFRR